MDFGSVLAQLRNKKGLSQKQLAEVLDVSNGAVAMWETNKRQPDIEMLKKIASFHNVSIDYIVGKQESEKSIYSISTNNLSNTLTNREQNLIETFRQLNSDNKDIAIGEIKKLLKEQYLIELQADKSSLKKIT